MPSDNLWYQAFEPNIIRFWDDEEEITMEEYRRRASAKDVAALDRDLRLYPELVAPGPKPQAA